MSALQLEDLPEEMILTVFTYLDIRDLMSCGQVSKRIRQIRNIESLWQNVDLQDIYHVKTDFIKFLLEKGCKCLNLYGGNGAKLKGSLKLDKPSKLERLNLEECSGKQALKEILNSCHSLQKVAFQEQRFDYTFVKQLILRNSKTLDTINLASFEWLTETSKLDFLGQCQELTEFKLTGDAFDIRSDQLDLMIDNLPPNILKIDLSWCQNLNDLHIEKLVRRCNKITEISLCFTQVTNQSVISIVKHLKNSLEVLALVECENVNLDDILDAGKHLTKLRLLFYEVHTGNVCMVGNTRFAENCANCEILKKDRPGLYIYDDNFSSIADVHNPDMDD